MVTKLLLATRNPGKARELKVLLTGIPYDVVTPQDMNITTEVEETGKTLEENARLKAAVLARGSGLLTMADDSGLEVDALGGEPGVMSARYAGENATDKQRVEYLLARLKDVPWEKRGAQFRCIIAVARPDGQAKLFEGTCRGIITPEPRGELGFGYDPIFLFPERGKTMAELPLELKNRISHRGLAAAKAREYLLKLAGQ